MLQHVVQGAELAAVADGVADAARRHEAEQRVPLHAEARHDGLTGAGDAWVMEVGAQDVDAVGGRTVPRVGLAEELPVRLIDKVAICLDDMSDVSASLFADDVAALALGRSADAAARLAQEVVRTLERLCPGLGLRISMPKSVFMPVGARAAKVADDMPQPQMSWVTTLNCIPVPGSVMPG